MAERERKEVRVSSRFNEDIIEVYNMVKNYSDRLQPKVLLRMFTAVSGVWIKVFYFIRSAGIYRQRINDIEISSWGITWLYIELRKTGFWFYEFFMHTQASQKSKAQGKSNRNLQP